MRCAPLVQHLQHRLVDEQPQHDQQDVKLSDLRDQHRQVDAEVCDAEKYHPLDLYRALRLVLEHEANHDRDDQA